MCTRQYLETCICIPADTQGLERIKVYEIILIIIILKLMIIHELQVDEMLVDKTGVDEPVLNSNHER